MARHIVLLGDSIFDNGFYVPDGPAVLDHLRRQLPPQDRATLVAVDGATVAAVFDQLDRIPGDATHLVLSVGGNDALRLGSAALQSITSDVRTSLQHLADAMGEFRRDYRRLLHLLRGRQLPLTVCTVYDSVPGLEAPEALGLCFFNDIITRTAFELGATLIDLRILCCDPSDYAPVSPIEPSESGGAKIARAIIAATSGASGPQQVVT